MSSGSVSGSLASRYVTGSRGLCSKEREKASGVREGSDLSESGDLAV